MKDLPLIFRPYTPADYPACLAVFDSNAGKFFAPGDREAFASFLKAPPGFYGVLELPGGAALGCGGVAVSGPVADLTWGMIHAKHHRRGLGRLLFQERLRRVQSAGGVEKVRMNTIRAVLGFYQKMGFRVVEVIPDGYGVGWDRYNLELSLKG